MTSLLEALNKLIHTLGQGNFVIALSLCAVIFALFILTKKKNHNNSISPLHNEDLMSIKTNIEKLTKIIDSHIQSDDFYNKGSKENLSKIHDELLRINTKLSVWIDSASSLEYKVDKINITTQILSSKDKP